MPGFKIFFSWVASATLISASVGRVGDIVVTSREVAINHFIEEALFNPGSHSPRIPLDPGQTKSPEFIRATTAVLFENAIFLEAESFSAASISDAIVEKQADLAFKKLKTDKNWKRLQVDRQEIRQILRRKLRAKDFMHFKMESAVIPISDREAKDYFDNNRFKFENLPFENFKDSIKNYLSRQQADRRLKDWYELLQSKYRVRNFLVEPA